MVVIRADGHPIALAQWTIDTGTVRIHQGPHAVDLVHAIERVQAVGALQRGRRSVRLYSDPVRATQAVWFRSASGVDGDRFVLIHGPRGFPRGLLTWRGYLRAAR